MGFVGRLERKRLGKRSSKAGNIRTNQSLWVSVECNRKKKVLENMWGVYAIGYSLLGMERAKTREKRRGSLSWSVGKKNVAGFMKCSLVVVGG